jgi:hypothetical protein
MMNIICLLVIGLIAIVCKIIASKTKSKSLKKLMEVLPSILLEAEVRGGTPADKLSYAVTKILETVKGITEKEAINAVEQGITISKTINVGNNSNKIEKIDISDREANMVSTITEVPVTVTRRELTATMSEEEVAKVCEVIAASGRASDIKDIYNQFAAFIGRTQV